MKAGVVFVVLALILAVLGAGLSYSGYAESLQIVTVTSTQSYTTMSTKTLPSTRSEISVFTTRSTLSILDEVLDIRGIKGTKYSGYYDHLSSTLYVGKVNISYRSEGGPVDFWMLDENAFNAYQARRRIDTGYANEAYKMRSSSGEFTVNIQETGAYYFVFVNRNQGPVSITLHVDGGLQTEVVTKTNEHVEYSTQVGTLVTQTVSSSSHPRELGLTFFAGIGLIVVAGIVLFAGTRKRPVLGPVPASQPAARAAQTASSMIPPPPPPAGKFCMSCGAPLPEYVSFCNKCGSKQ